MKYNKKMVMVPYERYQELKRKALVQEKNIEPEKRPDIEVTENDKNVESGKVIKEEKEQEESPVPELPKPPAELFGPGIIQKRPRKKKKGVTKKKIAKEWISLK